MTDQALIARAVRENRVHPGPSDVEAAAIRAVLAAAGRVIVPMEPTRKMEIAGALAADYDGPGLPSRMRSLLTYRAMIAAGGDDD